MKDWSKMTDREKIRDVVTSALTPLPGPRPSYDYLVDFIENLGWAYAEEIELRKSLAKHCMVLLLTLLAFALAFAWVVTHK